jgi:hypothetical protein
VPIPITNPNFGEPIPRDSLATWSTEVPGCAYSNGTDIFHFVPHGKATPDDLLALVTKYGHKVSFLCKMIPAKSPFLVT